MNKKQKEEGSDFNPNKVARIEITLEVCPDRFHALKAEGTMEFQGQKTTATGFYDEWDAEFVIDFLLGGLNQSGLMLKLKRDHLEKMHLATACKYPKDGGMAVAKVN